MKIPTPARWLIGVTGLLLIGTFVLLLTPRWLSESEPSFAGNQRDSEPLRSTIRNPNATKTTEDRVAGKSDDRIGSIFVNESSYTVAANPRGEFPRFYVDPGERIEGTATFLNVTSGSSIAIDAVDGGFLDVDHSVLDDEHRAHFRLDLPDYEGAHRVTLRHGSDVRTFEFWVGEEPPVIVRRD